MRQPSFQQLATIVVALIVPLSGIAEEPKRGSIVGEWSVKIGAQLDDEGMPAPSDSASRKGTWSWGVAASSSFRITWGSAPPAAVVPADASAWENRLIELTNVEREKLKRRPYKVDPALMKLARAQSSHMARLKKISHELEGRTFALRMKDAGYQALAAGENCAEGADSPETAVSDWMMSEGHKGNILSERYTHIGVGVAEETNGRRYFTQIFAKPLEEPQRPTTRK
ncbi:MAG TPA: CAP domain-containing protein [Planctomycetaceae bacterium]|nr:CAP domain-containing protein [Planctomycetaceae bacterium]